jgi:hypothetical protein
MAQERKLPMRFPQSLVLTFALTCAFTSTVPAASPFVGKWKLNAAKSNLTGTTDSVAAAGPNTWKFTYGTFSWTIKADGTHQPTPFGGTIALKVVSPSRWQLTNKANGKLISNDTWVVSDDGQSMIRASAGAHEDGQAFTDVTKFKRSAGAKSF